MTTDQPPPDQPPADRPPDPLRAGTDLRGDVRAYVAALHRSYREAGGGEAGAARLTGEPFTVVAAAAHSLHLVATREELAVDVPEAGTVEDAEAGMRWRLVFLDPSVTPGLGDVPDGPDEVRAVQRALGIESTLYHLAVGAGSALSAHHATHAGAGLAHREGADRGGDGAPA